MVSITGIPIHYFRYNREFHNVLISLTFEVSAVWMIARGTGDAGVVGSILTLSVDKQL